MTDLLFNVDSYSKEFTANFLSVTDIVNIIFTFESFARLTTLSKFEYMGS